MKKFLELLQSSVITQSVITIGVVGAWLYMTIAQIPIPISMENVVMIVVGFFFGSKYQQAISQPMIDMAKQYIQDNRPAPNI